MANATFAQAAFRHKQSGQVIGTGPRHDIEALPCGGENLEDYDDGFLTHEGKFYTRPEALIAVSTPLLHDGTKLHSQDLHLNELSKSVKDYDFEGPIQSGNQYAIHAKTKDGKSVGQLTFHASTIADRNHPHYGYHHIDQADVNGLHRKQGLYGRMLQLGSMFVKTQLKSRGLVSEGDVRFEAATGAWEKLSRTTKIQRMPGQDPEAPDFRMSEKDPSKNDPEKAKHEFLIALEQWLKVRLLKKYEDSLNGIVQNGGDVSDEDHRAATSMANVGAQYLPEFQAARFMANGVRVSAENLRIALLCYEYDIEMAALFAYNLPRTEENRKALRSVLAIQGMSKSELEVAALPRAVEAVLPEGQEFAQAIQRAFAAGTVHPVKLGGKHSKGTAIAVDPNTGRKYLVKPGSGETSPSAGVAEQVANQSRREAAFYQCAKVVGLEEFLPEAHLLRMDGHEVAVMDLVPTSYKDLNHWRRDPEFSARSVFSTYSRNGDLYKWAILDLILGSADRHAGNLMVSPDDRVQLIDEGTSFAGFGFNPANDSRSFIPCYLRAWADENFLSLEPQERLRKMPTPDRRTALEISRWVDQISDVLLAQKMTEYGLLCDPTISRLNALKAVAPEKRVEWVLAFWSGLIKA